MSQLSTPQARSRRKGRRRAKRSGPAPLLRTGLMVLTVAAGVAAAVPSNAQAPTRDEQPVLLAADQVTFDETQDLVTASGNVELSQGLRTVRADTIVYNRRTKLVTATGNIRLVEPSGEILFADYAELTDDLRNAFIDNVRMLMTDDGRMAGTEAERRGGVITRVNRAVYSPCDLCAEDRTRPPLWQIRAVRVVHDAEAKEIRYKDAVLELFGVPVAYTPYLSHPDPTVERRSGFLAPSFGNSSDLGLFLRGRYYVDIAPDQDATLELGGFSEHGLLVGGEYRKRFESGQLVLNGSAARGEQPSTDPNGDGGNRWRGHIAAKGLFDVDQVWRWGFDLNRASDETYLRRYYDVTDDFLTSRAFVEGFRGRNYAALNAYAFQDLRYGNGVEEPLVLPLAQYNALGDPNSLFGGRWSLDASVLGVYRQDGRTTQRVAVQPGWRREIVSGFGLVTTLDASVLAAGYNTVRADKAPDYQLGDDDTLFRFFPQAQVTFRYPFVRYGESSSQFIEPMLGFTAAPNIDNDDVPNEDSRDVEFDETILFRPNRFSGLDRLEGGSRVTYGLKAGYYGYDTGRITVFAGQSYRFSDENDFASGSGLEDRLSDYVGRIDFGPVPWLNVNYGFRLDRDSFAPRRHSLTASGGLPWLQVSTNYTYVDQTKDRNAVVRDEIEHATFGASVRLSSFWSVYGAFAQAYAPDPGPRSGALVLSYQDECFTFQTIARRDFTDVPGDDIESGTSILFRLVFKNIGEVKSPEIGTNFIGGDSGDS